MSISKAVREAAAVRPAREALESIWVASRKNNLKMSLITRKTSVP